MHMQEEKKAIIALCYDFDKTLCPTDMQTQGFIQSVGYSVDEFWQKTNEIAKNNEMDQISAYMLLMSQEAEGKIIFNREKLKEYGSKIELYNGVVDWFRRINAYGESKGVVIEHYIISSGIKEMIEGTKIADSIKKIFACSFYYNNKGVAKWPAQVVNYTNKTQYLFRIEKGILDVNDDKVNDYYSPDKVRIPFRNMIYIGDSDTDIPCMKLINSMGGYSIGVYDLKSNDKDRVYKMMRENRIKYFVGADYTQDSELDLLVKDIINRTVFNEKLENKYYVCKDEVNEYDYNHKREEVEKNNLILALENSGSFLRTHEIIAKIKNVESWNNKQIEKILTIFDNNSQVGSIRNDYDIKPFYNKILELNNEL